MCVEFILMSCIASYVKLCCVTDGTGQDEEHYKVDEVELMVQRQTELIVTTNEDTLETCAAATSITSKIEQSDEDFVIVE